MLGLLETAVQKHPAEVFTEKPLAVPEDGTVTLYGLKV